MSIDIIYFVTIIDIIAVILSLLISFLSDVTVKNGLEEQRENSDNMYNFLLDIIENNNES